MGRNPSYFSNGGGPAEAATGVDTSRYPVDSVTWYEAIEFCNKLSEKEGRQPYYQLADIERERRRFDKSGKGEHRGRRRLSFADGSTMGIRLSGRNDNPLQLWDGQQWRRVELQWQTALWDRATRSGIGQDRPSWQLSTECIRTVRHARQRVGMVLGRVPGGLSQELVGIRFAGTLPDAECQPGKIESQELGSVRSIRISRSLAPRLPGRRLEHARPVVPVGNAGQARAGVPDRPHRLPRRAANSDE